MKVYEQHDDQGRTFSIEIEIPARGRRGVISVLEKIEGLELTKRPKLLSSWREEIFCRFVLDGEAYFAEEPFGDNSRYWIGPDDCEWHPSFERVVSAFGAASRW